MKNMPAKEIKELRQAGKLEEAYAMALTELLADPANIWSKRNMSWVLYSQLESSATDLNTFLLKIEEIKKLAIPENEEMFFGNLSIVISKAARHISQQAPIDYQNLYLLFSAIKDLPLKRNVKWFSLLYSAFHKGMKDSFRYIEFADWWDLKNFAKEDFEKDKLPNGKEVMAIAEQAYITYAKHLLPKQTLHGETEFDKEKVQTFLPTLSQIVENYPQFQYPAYFNAKLLLALGEKENMLGALLPFAKKKRNDFWVWEIMAEAFSSEPEKVFACYCKALSCKSPDEMLVNLRQKMAKMLIEKNQYNEARTEIELLINSRTQNGFRIPNEVSIWQSMDWYKIAVPSKSNITFYHKYTSTADGLLFSDVMEELILVEFVNKEKKILNFIASETKFGFLKYDRFFPDIKIGETLKVRFQDGSNDGLYKLYTATKFKDDQFKNKFTKEIQGVVKISDGKSFGFIENVFIHPSIISKLQLKDGMEFSGTAIKTFNKEKKQWSWKLL